VAAAGRRPDELAGPRLDQVHPGDCFDELQVEVRKHRQVSAPTPIPDSPPTRMRGSEPTEAFRDAAAMIRAKQKRRTA
jgi:hypothetical protein